MIDLLVATYLVVIVLGVIVVLKTSLPKKVLNKIPDERPKVSIIIPTRNEGRNIRRCVESLKQLNYDNTEIIVVDGNSTDGTKEIVSSFDGVMLVEEPAKPDTWVGKPWACYNGYKQANGEILLFTDADTYHSPESLDTTVYYLQNESTGFLSLLTTQEFNSFWEHLLSIVFLIISVSVGGVTGTADTQIANGQYMLFTRERYEKLGTHTIVADSIIEDLEFGTKAAEQGYAPLIIYQKQLVQARMYQSLTEIRQGFGKNLALGVGQIGMYSLFASIIIQLWAMGWLVFPIMVISGILPASPVIWIITAFGYTSFALLLYLIEYNLSTSATMYVLFFPIYMLVFWIITSLSLLDTYIRKEISWKDRSYTIS